MLISGLPGTTIENFILNGYYEQTLNNGLRPKLYELSSPAYPITSFDFISPQDAILPSGNDINNTPLAVGRRIKYPTDSINSDRSGAFYFSDNVELIGTCHGFGRTEFTYYTGANFYNAFYPAGYFSPPFGENIDVFVANQNGASNLQQGACSPLTVTEYNKQFGIVSIAAADAALTSDTLTPNVLNPIYSPAEVCPPSIVVPSYYNEVNYQQIAGTVSEMAGGTYANDNPIPTSIDIYDIRVDGRYQTSGSGQYSYVEFFNDGTPIPSYDASSQQNKMNSVLCQSISMETSINAGVGSDGSQILDAPDVSFGDVGAQTSFAGADPFHYWHFTFKENAQTLPFYNDFSAVGQAQLNNNLDFNVGTSLFSPILSSEDSYWQNRQCPEMVDFLPYTFGGAIYACPSDHFDIPYYAATMKFGFYGTRFLNMCRRLDLDNGAMEEIESGNAQFPSSLLEPANLDISSNWSFSAYDNLLSVANAEQQYTDMYALNKGFFLWSNEPYIINTTQFNTLSDNYPNFEDIFYNLFDAFQSVYTNGLSSFLSGAPPVVSQSTPNNPNSQVTLIGGGSASSILFNTSVYDTFRKDLDSILTGTDINTWFQIENLYGYYVSNGKMAINEPFYQQVVSGREKRIRTRYFENFVRGNPIDLYPFNHITFSFDTASGYLASPQWGRSPVTVGFENGTLPMVNRRYFEGAYGHEGSISGVLSVLNSLTFSNTTSFYPGFFNDLSYGQTLPTPFYRTVTSGIITDTVGRKYSTSGWLAAGYHEIGGLRNNFSCFTPIFTQHPLYQVFCKIGQSPTFHAQAIDYHTIPDDKMTQRYPEIMYWAYKLKLVDTNFVNLYPLQYKWYRVPSNLYKLMIQSGTFNIASPSTSTGDWCCAEGDGPNCTFIHPQECYPVYTGINQLSSGFTFLKGAKLGIDDTYTYFCMASGRFGIRISEPSLLQIEDWMRFDISFKNGMNSSNALNVTFITNDFNGRSYNIKIQQDISTLTSPAYQGYQYDEYAIPESVIEQKVPPPNAGFGDVTAYRFVGPIAYVGTTRSYAPDTLIDTRGLQEAYGRFFEYGALIPLAKKLSQQEGDLLYGYQHLPVCTNYKMNKGQHGIQAIAYVGSAKVAHWTLGQQAFAAFNENVGILWNGLDNVGQLYPPANTITDNFFPGLGIGQWQWGNNLGAIKRFGYLSTSTTNDIVFLDSNIPQVAIWETMSPDQLITLIKQQVLEPTDLAGTNCGYTPYGLGRNMLYYIEAYERFFLICDQTKANSSNGNLEDISFLAPGLRQSNSAMQYFWLGHPSNTYLSRSPMYGPYAYKWKVNRHNRDRNGNGISEAFYSMGQRARYSLMYDAPAIFGLYLKKDATTSYKQQINDLNAIRLATFPNYPIVNFPGWWFGACGTEGTCNFYGNIMTNCSTTNSTLGVYACDYITSAVALGQNPDFQAYGCPQQQLQKGQCFDPCLSIRYAQGFFPAGKAQDLFGFDGSNSLNNNIDNIRLVPLANLDSNNNIITIDEPSVIDDTISFRSPINTPHARIWRGLGKINGYQNPTPQNIYGVSTCKDGGSDHCNYTTATIHLGTSSNLILETTAFSAAQNYIAGLFSSINIRGDSS